MINVELYNLGQQNWTIYLIERKTSFAISFSTNLKTVDTNDSAFAFPVNMSDVFLSEKFIPLLRNLQF